MDSISFEKFSDEYVDTRLLEIIISPFVVINSDDREVLLAEAFYEVDLEQQLALIVAVSEILCEEGVRQEPSIEFDVLLDSVPASYSEAYPVLRQLEKDGVVINTGMAYRLDRYNEEVVCDALTREPSVLRDE